MKKLYRAALLAALGLASATVAQADVVNPNDNDLVIGFTSQAAGVTQDYLVDLGAIPTTPGANLSSSISLSAVQSIFGAGNLSGGNVNVGIVGGAANPADYYMSVLRTGSNPYTLAGSTTPNTISKGGLAATANPIALMDVGPGASGLGVDQSSLTSWTYEIAKNPTTVGTAGGASSSFLAGSNPMTTIGSSEIVDLDIYKEIYGTGQKFVYQGYFQLDLSGSQASLAWDPVAVPEPATYGMFAGAGLLALSLRRQLSRKTA